MPTLPLLMMEIDIEGLAARVDLNGVRVFQSDGGRSLRQNRRLNAWALPNSNELTIGLARRAEGEASFSLALRIVRPGEPVDDVEPFLTYQWSSATDPLTPAPRLVFRAPVAFGAPRTWSWTGAPAREPGGQDRAEIDELLRRLRRALVERRAGEAIELQAVQLEENAVAVGDSPGAYRGQYEAFLSEFMADPGFEVEGYDSADLQLEPMAGGRIVHATQAGRPALRARTPERMMAIDPYLSRVDGRWTIVR